ncbi:acyltransferase [Asticcacaulis sp. MM231]|uniref:acyltransferase family protein n=1 Tax=Asticcacaulis sp. MM231 TaxID=3157666 RepID=UPI0032D57556
MSESNHYKAFDGLRGFAAISVVLFHIGHWLGVPWLATNSGLAVDLFFCLSGYVMVLAYGACLKESMTLAKFARVRLVRLMPMILLGLLISILYSVISIFAKHEPVDQLALALAFLLAMVNLPYLHAPTSIGGPQVFPLNGPQYSLFLELAANFVWALLRRIDGLVLSLSLTVVSFALMLLFPGGGDETATFWQGIPRVCTSFCLGVALFFADARFLQGRAAGSRLWHWLFWISVVAMVVIFYTPVPLHALSQWL